MLIKNLKIGDQFHFKNSNVANTYAGKVGERCFFYCNFNQKQNCDAKTQVLKIDHIVSYEKYLLK